MNTVTTLAGYCRSLGVDTPWHPRLFDLPVPELDEGGVQLRTLYSGLSAGTELGYVKGTDPGFHSRHDKELGVFVAGEGSSKYPVTSMGYMEVAEVVDSRRAGIEAGSVVAAAYGHRSSHVLDSAGFLYPVPDDLDPLLGVYLAQMGPICANGLLHAAAEFSGPAASSLAEGVHGRRVLVTGAGVVGLLTALFVLAHDAAEVAVADPDPERLQVAAQLGAEAVDEGAVPAWRWCKQRWAHGPADRGADVVFQCRGRSAVLADALRALRPQGAVIDLAFYQTGAPELRLGEEFHHNGLTIRCAQIARVPRGMGGRWNRARLAAETAALLTERADVVRRQLITDVVPIDQAPAFLEALARREVNPLTAVFAF